MGKLTQAAVLIVVALLLTSVCSSIMFRASAQSSQDDALFKLVWSDSLGFAPVWGGYYIVSDCVFPLKVCVLNLPGVGNYRLSNHSEVLSGVQQAVQIDLGSGQINELNIKLYDDRLVAKIQVNVSLAMIQDWETYKTLVESTSNIIIVNTYDEYLPVPDGYGKEEWADKVADFMLNHWGTWVHAGGYPFYRAWYQNGTIEEWGVSGFQRVLGHIGRGNVVCYPPQGMDPEDMHTPFTISGEVREDILPDWRFAPGVILESNPGYPLKWEDFSQNLEFEMFGNVGTYSHSALRFSPNQTQFNFGTYVHLGMWKLQDVWGEETAADRIIGFLSTAVSIFEEYYNIKSLYGGEGYSASEAIQKAQKEGRTIGLSNAQSLFESSLDAYQAGNYKLAAAYAEQATRTANEATGPSIVPQVIAITATVASAATAGTYYQVVHKNKKKKNG